MKDWSQGDFSEVDFSGAILTGKMNGTHFNRAYLVGAQFKTIQMGDEKDYAPLQFNNAKLGFAELRKMPLAGADLTQADLSFADASEAVMNENTHKDGAIWYKTILEGVKYLSSLEKQKEIFETFHAQWKKRDDELNQQMQGLRDSLKPMISKLDDLDQQIESCKDDNRKSLTEIKEQLAELMVSKVNFEQYRIHNEIRVSQLQLNQKKDEEEIIQLKKINLELDNRIQSLGDKINALSIEVDHLIQAAKESSGPQSGIDFRFQGDAKRNNVTGINRPLQSFPPKYFDEVTDQGFNKFMALENHYAKHTETMQNQAKIRMNFEKEATDNKLVGIDFAPESEQKTEDDLLNTGIPIINGYAGHWETHLENKYTKSFLSAALKKFTFNLQSEGIFKFNGKEYILVENNSENQKFCRENFSKLIVLLENVNMLFINKKLDVLEVAGNEIFKLINIICAQFSLEESRIPFDRNKKNVNFSSALQSDQVSVSKIPSMSESIAALSGSSSSSGTSMSITSSSSTNTTRAKLIGNNQNPTQGRDRGFQG